jgi:hypothetical protein
VIDVSLHCPYCGKHTAVSPAPLDVSMGPGTMGAQSLQYIVQGVPFYETGRGKWWLGKCNSCELPLLVCDKGSEVFPTPQPTPSDERIPEHIRRDLDEAKKCTTVGAFRACATMARRAIQAACLLKEADEKKKLFEQIDQLAAEGKITSDLKKWAHEVRYLGNDGAHPPKDYKNDVVSQEDARDALELAEQFLEVLFVLPALAEERRKKRTSKP